MQWPMLLTPVVSLVLLAELLSGRGYVALCKALADDIDGQGGGMTEVAVEETVVAQLV